MCLEPSAHSRGELEASRVPGMELLYALRAVPDILVFVRKTAGEPIEPVDIMRPAGLRTLGLDE